MTSSARSASDAFAPVSAPTSETPDVVDLAGGQDLLWLRSAQPDCFPLHPATVVRSPAVGARAA